MIVSKYVDHLPLYCQEHIFERFGLELSRSTTCGWMAACAKRLEPLWRRMRLEVLASRWCELLGWLAEHAEPTDEERRSWRPNQWAERQRHASAAPNTLGK